MKILTLFKKLGRLKEKSLSGKGAALFLLNRKIPELAGGKNAFGKITDLRLEREAKSVSFEISRDSEVNTITVKGYHIDPRLGQSCLSWDVMEFDGPARERYRKIFQNIDRIEISKRYIFMLEAVL